MSSRIRVVILDKVGNIKQEGTMVKPKTFENLIKQMKFKFKNLTENIQMFILDKDKKEIKIKDEDDYKLTNDKIYLREIDNSILEQSLYEINYNKLPESKQEVLDERYSCVLCINTIKNENPYFCYNCQKIFHNKCLNNWDKECKSQYHKLKCPNCRNELPIEKWKKKLNYEEDRTFIANLIDKINEYENELNTAMNNSNNKNKKQEQQIKYFDIIKQYEKYIEETSILFKHILKKINLIHSLLNFKTNDKLSNLINKYHLNIKSLDLTDISKVINEELNLIKNFTMTNSGVLKDIVKFQSGDENDKNRRLTLFNFNKSPQKKMQNYMDKKDNNSFQNGLNEIKNDEYNKTIKITYFTELEGNSYIFGSKFVENNKDNIVLIINGEQSKLVTTYDFKKGENIITILVKNKLVSLSSMFSGCKSVKNINELKYLDVKEVTDFSQMFSECALLSDLTALKNWDVSNGDDFNYMFNGCKALSDISPLQNWDVSSATVFQGMFFGCYSLWDIKPLKSWNVSNGKNLSHMFQGCTLLYDLKPLQNWNVSNCTYFSYMFYLCTSLSNIKPLKTWNVSKGFDFSYMFFGCSSLSDIKSLKNWNVSASNNLSYIFHGCSSLSDIKSLINWDVSNCKDFAYIFYGCEKLSDITSLQNWNVTNGNSFTCMFAGCTLLSDLTAIKNWDVSNGEGFSYMFSGCSSLEDISPLQKWNVSHGNNFTYMFSGCSTLLNIKPLEKWNISKENFKSLK